ncbi:MULTISPECIES: PhoH family protein [Cellulosilyticum]|uniref:PhoH-like protein n=1 Tax=Cellulosilyticum lentocellum (strain ATCC 49066 / DSM 5427 / NCIMB 11756 / RHM5) TaxID=642492 RepID=F2JQA8_CELLD|nr:MULTISPECIES: PhoH family protein [Cellulosilyticum]ADZ83770.1 PhoH family protein [Cellulosilyticum lentocellum DSM 5427]
MSKIEKELEVPAYDIGAVFGQFDENLILIEKTLRVSIILRNDKIKVGGTPKQVDTAITVLNQLFQVAKKNEEIDAQRVKYILDSLDKYQEEQLNELSQEAVILTHLGKPIKCKTVGQSEYIKKIKKNTVVFGIGPAGTGKTYLAMAMAVNAFRKNEVSKIILTRPAIEAGEKLGFLPGDLQSKVDPYLRPLYDALFEIMGPENFEKNMEKGLIEVAPLAYMRGRTLNNAFIVLDEAQNTTSPQMKMFLTRIGFNSKVVVTGDLTQVDLPSEKMSGLKVAMKILEGVEGIGFSYLSKNDVVRHPIVQRIVEAYDAFENKVEKE